MPMYASDSLQLRREYCSIRRENIFLRPQATLMCRGQAPI